MILIHSCLLADLPQIKQLFDMGVIEVLCLNLGVEDVCLFEYIIEALENLFFYGEILKTSEKLIENPYAKSFEELGGLQFLSEKMNFFPEKLCLKIENLYEKYF